MHTCLDANKLHHPHTAFNTSSLTPSDFNLSFNLALADLFNKLVEETKPQV